MFEGKFQAEDSRRHRFTWVRVKVDLSEMGDPAEVLKMAPRQAYGVTIPEERTSNWALSSKLSIAVPGFPLTLDLFNAQKGHSKSYQIDRMASMKGSERGKRIDDQAVWTIEEAGGEGIPLAIPSLVLLLKITPGRSFTAKFSVEAKVGFSLNPMRWPLVSSTPRSVCFNGSIEYLAPGEDHLDRNFTSLDVSQLTRLDFKDGV